MAFFVFTRVLLCARRDGAMKDSGPNKKHKSYLGARAMAADFAPFPPINEIRCSLLSSRSLPARKLFFIVEIMTVEESGASERRETSRPLFARIGSR